MKFNKTQNKLDIEFVLTQTLGVREELKVKLGSTLFKYFLIINDMYNGAKILNLPRVVVKMIFFFKY